MRTLTKWVGGFGLAIVAVLLLGVLLVAWVIGTNSGTRWLFDRVAGFIDADLHADSITGTLASTLTLRDLRYVAADQSLTVRADTASIELSLNALLQRTLHVESARILGLAVASRSTETAEPTEQDATSAWINPPLDMIIDDLIVREAQISRDGEQVLDVQRLELAGRWTDAALVIDDLDLEADQADAQLAGELRRDGEIYAVNARGEFQYRAGEQQITGSLRAETDQGALTLAVQLSDPTRAQLFARVQQRKTHSWSLEAEVPKFDPSALGMATLDSLALSLEGSGTRAGGSISGSIIIDGEPVRLHPLQFSIDPQRIGIELLADVGAARSEVSATGEILLGAEPWRADLDVKWEEVTLPPALAGQTLVTRGDLQLTGNLQQFAARGALALGPPGRAADIKLDVAGSPERIRIDELRVVQPDGFLSATGELLRQPQLRWDVQASASSFDPGAFLPDWSGNLQFELDTEGSLTDAGPRGELLLNQLSGELRGHPVSGSADLKLTTQPSLAGRLHLQSGASRLQVSADRGEAWDATVDIRIASLEEFVPQASGSLNGKFSITGEWPSLDVRFDARATDLLLGDVGIDSARLQLDIEGLRAPSGSAQLRADDITIGDVTFDSAAISLSGREERHTLTARASGTPGSIQLRATGSLADAQGDRRWSGTIRRLVLDLRDMQSLTLINPAGLVASRSLVDLSSLCLTSTDGRLCAAGEIRFDAAQGGTWVDGSVTANIPDIATLTLASTNVANLDGRVRLQAEVEGPLADPALQLSLHAERLAAEIPRLGLQLRDGVINAESRGDNEIAVSGSIRSGEGELTVAGVVTTTGAAELQIDGEQLLAADIAGARVIAAPDLHFVRGPERMLLEGRVTIPTAEINVQQLRRVDRVETGSPDVVIIGAKTQQEVQAQKFPLRADVTVVLGEDVTVSGFGLQAEVDGQVAIREAPGEPTLASGEVRAEGTYEAFGQELTITQGRVLFADSPLDNPRLNIVATREIEDVTSGVRITGPAQSPELQVFSDPAMDEANALAYLLTGRPLGEVGVTEQQGDVLTSAAESLGGAAGGLLAQRIGERLGLDVATVEESELTGSQVFTVGEYLSPRLYVGYGVGLFEPGDVITLRYRLSDDVAVRAVRGPEESRLGVEYRVER